MRLAEGQRNRNDQAERKRLRQVVDRLEDLEGRLVITDQGVRVATVDTPRLRIRANG